MSKPTKEIWIVAIDSDSFNYTPQKLKLDQIEKAHEEGFIFYYSQESCQVACDHQNSL